MTLSDRTRVSAERQVASAGASILLTWRRITWFPSSRELCEDAGRLQLARPLLCSGGCCSSRTPGSSSLTKCLVNHWSRWWEKKKNLWPRTAWLTVVRSRSAVVDLKVELMFALEPSFCSFTVGFNEASAFPSSSNEDHPSLRPLPPTALNRYTHTHAHTVPSLSDSHIPQCWRPRCFSIRSFSSFSSTSLPIVSLLISSSQQVQVVAMVGGGGSKVNKAAETCLLWHYLKYDEKT